MIQSWIRSVFAALAAAGVLVVASSASADEHVALSIERVGGIAYSSLRPTGAGGSASVTTFGVGGMAVNPIALPRLGVDVVFPSGMTLGAGAGYGVASLSLNPDGRASSTTTASTALFSPRVGYRASVAPWLDLTGRVGLTLARATLTEEEDDSVSLFAAAASIEAVGAFRITSSFHVLAGLSYDHVIAASASSESTVSPGSRSGGNEDVDGRYLGAQMWLGMGGYL